MTVQEIKDSIKDRTDGPVTRFVMLSRAFALVEAGEATAENAANAVEEELLEDWQDLSTNEGGR